MRTHSLLRRYVLAAIAVGGLALSWVWWPRARPPLLRAGTNQSPQFNFRDESGVVRGFAVDVLNEAAQRAGYRLEWVFLNVGPDIALAKGTVDIWPIVAYRPEREASMHLT